MEHLTLLCLAALVAGTFILTMAPKVVAPLDENADAPFSSFYEDNSPPEISSRQETSSD